MKFKHGDEESDGSFELVKSYFIFNQEIKYVV